MLCFQDIFSRAKNSASLLRDGLQTCSQRRLQRQSPFRRRHVSHGADLFHDAINEKVEDLQLALESLDELFIGFNPHDNLWKYVMPAYDIDPASLGDVELTLQLRPEAFIDISANPVIDLSLRQRGLDFQ